MAAMKTLRINALDSASTRELAELLEQRLRTGEGVGEVSIRTLNSIGNQIEVHVLNVYAMNASYLEHEEMSCTF
jgi:hypothetical protein